MRCAKKTNNLLLRIPIVYASISFHTPLEFFLEFLSSFFLRQDVFTQINFTFSILLFVMVYLKVKVILNRRIAIKDVFFIIITQNEMSINDIIYNRE